MTCTRRTTKTRTRSTGSLHIGGRSADNLVEHRDIGGSSVWAGVPHWLVTDPAPEATNTAPLVRLLAKPLPAGVTDGTVNPIGWGTEPVSAAQSGLNGTITAPSIVDTTSGPTVRTYSVRVKMPQQLFDQGREALDAQLIPTMVNAVNASIDSSIINDDGAGGTVTGIRSTVGITATTYTDATPTVLEGWPIIEEAVRGVEIGYGGSPILIMHPRRLAWLRQHAVTENLAAFNFSTPTLPGAACTILGSVNVVADANVATTAGGGTEDVVIVIRGRDSVDLFVGPPTIDIGSVPTSTLEVYVTARRQVAFTASRLPATIAVVAGTGLIAPTP